MGVSRSDCRATCWTNIFTNKVPDASPRTGRSPSSLCPRWTNRCDGVDVFVLVKPCSTVRMGKIRHVWYNTVRYNMKRYGWNYIVRHATQYDRYDMVRCVMRWGNTKGRSSRNTIETLRYTAQLGAPRSDTMKGNGWTQWWNERSNALALGVHC